VLIFKGTQGFLLAIDLLPSIKVGDDQSYARWRGNGTPILYAH
jgi:hypothetical protein